MECLTSEKLSLKLFQMLTCIERSMAGQVSNISKRYSKTSNTYLKSYDSKQQSKHIIYLDGNNLYGYAMSKFLPTKIFKWIDPRVSFR